MSYPKSPRFPTPPPERRPTRSPTIPAYEGGIAKYGAAERGEIGAVARRPWSGFMGRIYNRGKIVKESAPAFAQMPRDDGVDVLVAIPA